MISWQDAVDMEKIPEQALDNPLYDDLREQILALPDVDAITSYDAVTVEIDLPRKADTFIITAMSREQFSQQLPDNRIAAGTADYDALAEGNGILISDSSDHILSGYEYTPQIGDVLHLKTYGGQDMDLNVMGIVKDGSRDATGVLASLFILPEETLHKLYPEVKNFQMVWNVHAAQDSDVLRTQLFQIAENPALTIIARSDLTATFKPLSGIGKAGLSLYGIPFCLRTGQFDKYADNQPVDPQTGIRDFTIGGYDPQTAFQNAFMGIPSVYFRSIGGNSHTWKRMRRSTYSDPESPKHIRRSKLLFSDVGADGLRLRTFNHSLPIYIICNTLYETAIHCSMHQGGRLN